MNLICSFLVLLLSSAVCQSQYETLSVIPLNDIPDLTLGKPASLVITHSNASNFEDSIFFPQNRHLLGREL